MHVRGLAWAGVFERGAEGRDRCSVSGILGSRRSLATLVRAASRRSLLTLSECGEEASGSIGDLVHVRGLAWAGVFERGAEGRDRCPVSGILGSRVSNDFGLGKCDF